MVTVQKFTDLECWKHARINANTLYNLFGEIRDFGFRDQILRAGVSVMNNIAEGFGRQTDKDRIRFLDIAIGSLNEVQSMLYLASDRKFISEIQMKDGLVHATETMNLLYGFRRHLAKNLASVSNL